MGGDFFVVFYAVPNSAYWVGFAYMEGMGLLAVKEKGKTITNLAYKGGARRFTTGGICAGKNEKTKPMLFLEAVSFENRIEIANVPQQVCVKIGWQGTVALWRDNQELFIRPEGANAKIFTTAKDVVTENLPEIVETLGKLSKTWGWRFANTACGKSHYRCWRPSR